MQKVRGEIQSTNLESNFICSYSGEQICKMSEMREMGLGKFGTQGLKKFLV